nr:unnamed protein product [Homo sapiens]
MAAASVTPPGSLELLQPGFSKTLLGTKLEAKYLCSACRNVLRRPFQAQCGHRYCSFCLASILSSGPQNCAACVHEGIYEEGISILESSSAFPDNAARREVESLPAVCPSDGCTWKGTLKEYEVKMPACGMVTEAPAVGSRPRSPSSYDLVLHVPLTGAEACLMSVEEETELLLRSCHEGRCPLMLTECPACKGLVRLGEKERHLEHECPERSLSCRHCRAPCCGADVKAHHEVCPKFPLTCDGCGKKKIPREKFQDQDKIEALSSKVQQLERSIGLKDLAMADLEQKVLEMEASTYDGVFIWKISDFARKRQEAVAGRIPAIFSPAFYTSRYGYKMCLRIYLNGDGTGRGTHLSLFFVVMKGPNDALLRWPFNQKVTLMLLDQNNREHVIDAFRPDVTSSSFQRPVNDMNIASGCPLFCPVSKMEAKNSYVRDDAIFIKAIVDLTGL